MEGFDAIRPARVFRRLGKLGKNFGDIENVAEFRSVLSSYGLFNTGDPGSSYAARSEMSIEQWVSLEARASCA